MTGTQYSRDNSACIYLQNQEVIWLPRFIIWRSCLNINLVGFQNFHLNIAFSFIYVWNTIITPNLTHYLSQYSLYKYIASLDKIRSHWLPGIKFWKSQTNFWESLTPRLPLMQALGQVTTVQVRYWLEICCHGYAVKTLFNEAYAKFDSSLLSFFSK